MSAIGQFICCLLPGSLKSRSVLTVDAKKANEKNKDFVADFKHNMYLFNTLFVFCLLM
jgi:hypothetical protein